MQYIYSEYLMPGCEVRSHAGLGDPFVVLERLVVVELVEVALVLLLALKHGEQALGK